MICTFYSYKGGVGRSMAMANVADLLSRRGLKVLMIDFDLEAPGLERFFQVNQESVLRQLGLLDLVLAYKRSMSLAGDEAEFKDLSRFICPIYEKLPGAGTLSLMPAGRRNGAEQLAQYALSLRTLDWQDFYFNWQGELFFEWVRRSLTQQYDLVLIDSRTGVTEMGGICGYQLPDVLVMMCAANHQNIEGTRNMVRDFRSASVSRLRRGRSLEIVVVPARIEQHDPELLAGFFQRFDAEFADSLPARLTESGRTFRDLMVPYEPAFAFEERVVSDPLQYAQRKRISSAFEQLAEAVCWLAEPNSKLGQKASQSVAKPVDGGSVKTVVPVEPHYDVARRFSGYDVFIESSAADRKLAEELCARVKQRGLQIFYDRNDVSMGAEWEAVVGEALFHSRALVSCQGSEPLSAWRLQTLQRARANPAIRVLTALLPGVDPDDSYRARALASVDLRGGIDDEGVDRLVAALKQERPSASVEMTTLEPFPGMQAFDEEHSKLFFGRSDALEKLRELVEHEPLVALSGASGSGKTSLVRGGLIPALRATPGSSWKILELSPGTEPERALAELELEAEPLGQGQRRLLVIDSFEDLFSRVGALERGRFFSALSAFRARTSACVLLVVRSDFSSKLDELAPLILPAKARLKLEAMTGEELLSALVGPAESAGLAFEPGLAERISSEMRSDPHALRLLQALLRELWERRRDGWLTNAAYDRIGGLPGVVSRKADALYESLDANCQKMMASLSLALVTVDANDADYTRSRVNLESLRPSASARDPELARAFEHTFEALLTAGLVRVTDQGGARQVELAHEALLRGWPRLREWVHAEQEALRVRQALEVAQRTWSKSQKRDDALLRGEILNVAKHFRDQHAGTLTLAQLDFIEASAAAQRRARRRSISLLAVMTGVVLLVLLFVNVLKSDAAKAQAAQSAAARAAAAATASARIQSALNAARSEARQLRSEGDKLALQNRTDEAIDRYTKAVEKDPAEAGTVFQLGVLRLRRADLKSLERGSPERQVAEREAEQDISRAIELVAEPAETAQYYLKRGDLRLAQDRDTEALADYEAAMQLDANRTTWFALARAHDKLAARNQDAERKRDELQLAIKAYSYAIASDEKFGEAYFNRAAAYEKLGDREAAAKDFSKVATLDVVESQLKVASQTRASKLGVKSALKLQTQVFFQYADARDEGAVTQLMGSLKSPAYGIEPAQLVKANTSAQVRFFFPEDQAAANDLRDKIQRQLAAQGFVLRISAQRLDVGRFPSAKAGRVEVWLPSLSSYVPAASPAGATAQFGAPSDY